nr:MAG TPA: hypothetical protein [Caudoviricetes sp.]
MLTNREQVSQLVMGMSCQNLSPAITPSGDS